MHPKVFWHSLLWSVRNVLLKFAALQENPRDPHESLDFNLAVHGLGDVRPVVSDDEEVVVEGLNRMVRVQDNLGPCTDLTHHVQEFGVRIHREVAVFQMLFLGLDEGVAWGRLLVESQLGHTRQGRLEAKLSQ